MEKAVPPCLTALQSYLTHKPVYHTQCPWGTSLPSKPTSASHCKENQAEDLSVHGHPFLTLPDLQQQPTKAETSNRRLLGGKDQHVTNTAHFLCQGQNRQGTQGRYPVTASSVHFLGVFHFHMSWNSQTNGNPSPGSSAFSRNSAPLQS